MSSKRCRNPRGGHVNRSQMSLRSRLYRNPVGTGPFLACLRTSEDLIGAEPQLSCRACGTYLHRQTAPDNSLPNSPCSNTASICVRPAEVASNQWALPSAAGGRLTRHPCQGAVRQLGVAARLPLKTKADGDSRLLWGNLRL